MSEKENSQQDDIIVLDESGANTELEAEAINLINQVRQTPVPGQQILAPLQADATLNRLAAIKAQDMALNNSCDHFSPTIGGDEGTLLAREGINNVWWVANIACGSGDTMDTAEEAVNAWVNSAPHLANILNPNITRIGLGQFYSAENDTNYWSMIATSDFQAPVQNGWLLQNGHWFYYINGVAQRGWLLLGSSYYQFDENTAIFTGYAWFEGTWFLWWNSSWFRWNGTSWEPGAPPA